MAFCYPFLIKSYLINSSDNDLKRLIKLFENLTFRYLLRGGRAEMESRLNQYLVSLSNKNEIKKTIEEIISNINNNGRWSYWSDTQVAQYLDSGFFYGNRVDNYFLC